MKTILITGGDGLVGKALRSHSPEYNCIFVTRKDADLTKESDVIKLFEVTKPNYVIHTAAKVGGIGGNLAGHADYFYQNILMNTQMIHHAWKFGVEKMLVFSSVCAFPSEIFCVNESLLQEGKPYVGNFAYGYAKRMVDVQIEAYKSQYKINNFCSLIPGNIFGENDYYNLVSGHVLPSLIRKVYHAVKNSEDLVVWGDGSALREFIYSKDIASIIYKLLDLNELPSRVIVSSDEQRSIKSVVEYLCEIAGFKGNVIWNGGPSAAPSRSSDTTLLKSLVTHKFTDFDVALKSSYDWFVDNWPDVRQ